MTTASVCKGCGKDMIKVGCWTGDCVGDPCMYYSLVGGWGCFRPRTQYCRDGHSPIYVPADTVNSYRFNNIKGVRKRGRLSPL